MADVTYFKTSLKRKGNREAENEKEHKYNAREKEYVCSRSANYGTAGSRKAEFRTFRRCFVVV